MTSSPYDSYLRTADLLSLQRPRTPREHEAVRQSEHFFIVVHQAAELLLRQALADLRVVMEKCDEKSPSWPQVEKLLARSSSVLELQCELTQTLQEHLPQEDFASFRSGLGKASAGQSQQFAQVFELVGTLTEGQVASALHRSGEEPPRSTILRLEEARFALRRWQLIHVELVSQMIGESRGSAGTNGTGWLRSRIAPDQARRTGASVGH